MTDVELVMARRKMNEIFDELEYWMNYVLPADGETWEKKPCGKGLCSMGHSLGVGVHKVDFSTGFAWGTTEQIKCGCLVKIHEPVGIEHAPE